MVKNFTINPEVYSLAFTTSDLVKFEMIRKCFISLPNSKIKVEYGDKHNSLIINKDFYEQAIDEGIKFINERCLEDGVYWVNKNGLFLPIGFYQVAVAKPFNSENSIPKEEIIDFFDKMVKETNSFFISKYDYLTKNYNISLKGNDYDELVDKFNEFLIKNGTEPFESIGIVSRYGKIESKEYPILNKRI